jgi:hypothetical protein
VKWAVSARYAAPGSRPSRRYPIPEDFCRRTVVGPAGAATVEAAFDLLGVPENVRVRIRANHVVRDFVEGRLLPDQSYPHFVGGRFLPDQPYPHDALGMHYVDDPAEHLVEWDLSFGLVAQIIDGTGGAA